MFFVRKRGIMAGGSSVVVSMMTWPSGKNRRYLWSQSQLWELNFSESQISQTSTCSTQRDAKPCRNHPKSSLPDGCMIPCWYRHLETKDICNPKTFNIKTLNNAFKHTPKLSPCHTSVVSIITHCLVKISYYHQNGHEAVVGTCPSRTWSGPV